MNKFETRYAFVLLIFIFGETFGVLLSTIEGTVGLFLLFGVISAITILFMVFIFETIMAGKPDDD